MGDERYLTAEDKILWDLDRDPRFRASVASLLLLDRPPDWDRFTRKMERLTRLQPYLRSRLVETPLGLAPPRWAFVDDFDLPFHLRRVAVPAGGGMREVLDLAATWASSTYDPTRPLWHYTLIEGLPDGRAALLQLAHHVVSDGVGGVELATQFFDPKRKTPVPEPLPPEPTPENLGAADLIRDAAVRSARQTVGAAVGAARLGAVLALRAVREPTEAGRDARAYAASAGRLLAPVTERASSVMTDRSVRRRYDVLDVSLDALREAAHVRGASVNDAFLTAVGGGLGRYHDRAGALPEALRITTMISIRRSGDPDGGNRVNSVRYEIPVGVGDVERRLDEMKAIGARVRAEPAVDLPRRVAAVVGQLPTALMVPVYGSMLTNMDALATNVPGIPSKVFVSGARVDGWYAFGPTEGSAVGVALISHAGRCCVGITSDTAAIDDPDALVRCLGEGFDEVLGLAG